MSGLIPREFAGNIAEREPGVLEAGARYAVSGADWLRGLPQLLTELLTEWGLTPDGPTRWGSCAVAVPVSATMGQAVLKVSWPHFEARTEHLALRHWDGHGAVRLLRADPHRFALLLERLDATTDLTAVPIDDACEVIGDLLAQLAAPAIARIPTLSTYAARQAAEVGASDAVLPRRFVEQARHLAQDFAAEPASDGRLLHTDLHYVNVLKATRQPWLAIDPKPTAGDPAFEVAPVLWNRIDELGTGSSVRSNLRRRLEIICERAGIDQGRAKGWTIIREVDNAMDEPPGSQGAGLAVAIIKAMND